MNKMEEKMVTSQQPSDGSALTVAYIRVGPKEWPLEVRRQRTRIVDWAQKNGVSIDRWEEEVGSSMNEFRPVLTVLLADPNVKTIIVLSRRRMARYGFHLIEQTLRASNRSLTVIEEEITDHEASGDLYDILVDFAGRLFNKDTAIDRAKVAISTLLHPSSQPPKKSRKTASRDSVTYAMAALAGILFSAMITTSGHAESPSSPLDRIYPREDCTTYQKIFPVLIGRPLAEVQRTLGALPGIRHVSLEDGDSVMTAEYHSDRARLLVENGKVKKITCG
jgi:predicted site-specific integrase-resolvase